MPIEACLHVAMLINDMQVKLQCADCQCEPIRPDARPINCQLYVRPALEPLESHCCCFWPDHSCSDCCYHLKSSSYPLMTIDGLLSMSLLLLNAFSTTQFGSDFSVSIQCINLSIFCMKFETLFFKIVLSENKSVFNTIFRNILSTSQFIFTSTSFFLHFVS